MKEKNSKKRKVLLMVTASVLVAALSVGATLAYLTARTDPKDNIFKAANGIQLKVLEPRFDSSKTLNTEPGHTTNKDPIVQNDTEDRAMYVGVKLTFFIDTTTSDASAYQQVTYDVFKEYVTVNGLSTTTYPGSDFTGTSGNWYNVTSQAGTNTEGALYFMYDKKLAGDDGDVTYDNGYKDSGSGTVADNTTPVFTSVTPDKDITIRPSKYSGTYTTEVDSNGPTGVYQYFNYKIQIDAFGVEDEISLTNNASATEKQKVTAATSIIVDKLK